MPFRKEWFFRQKTVWKTTWVFRLLVATLCGLLLLLTGSFWLESIGRSLIHADELEAVDLIVVEDFDENYWLHRIAANLQAEGRSSRVIVVKATDRGAQYVTAALADAAGLDNYELLESGAGEPIALNAAIALRERLGDEPIGSIIVVATGFRSQRTHLIYEAVFEGDGIEVLCRPVLGPRRPDNWWHSWHGIQEIGLEFVKLQYYRFWVL